MTRTWPPLVALALLGSVVVMVVAWSARADAEDPELVDLQPIVDEAEPGAVVTLPEGTYRGPVVIDRPITLVGDGHVVVDGGGAGNVFEVTSPDVTLQGLEIRASGDRLDREHSGVSADHAHRLRVVDNVFVDVLFGMFIRSSDDIVVSGNTIGGMDLFIARRGDGIRIWECSGALVEHNRVADGRDTVFWFAEDVTVLDNRVSGGRYGLHFMYADGAVVERNVLDNNSVGIFLMYSTDLSVRHNVVFGNRGPSGYGLGLKDMDGVVVEGNHLEDNRVGLYVDNSPTLVDGTQIVRNNVFAYNDAGALLRPSVRDNSFSENAFIDNVEQVGVDGGGRIVGNDWSADGVGNHWSDFAGYDADGDGIGDIAYELDDLFSELTDRHPELTFFTGTPAARAVDMAGRAFPNLRPEPKLVDDAPLVAIPDFPEVPSVGGQSQRPVLALTSVALLAVAASIVLWARPSRTVRSIGAPS